MANTVADLVANLRLDTKGFNAPIAGAQGKLSGFTNFLGGPATLAIGGMVTAIAGVGAALVSLGNEWDEATGRIRTATGATGQNLKELEESAKAVFREVPVSANAAADAIGTLNTLTGATGPTLENLASRILEVSDSLGEQAIPNAEAFGKALNQFELSASQAGPQLDHLFKLTQDYGISLTKLTTNLTEYGSVLKNAGLSMEESADLFARLSSEGISVSRVMPGINAAMRRMAESGQDIRTGLNDAVRAIRDTTSQTEALAIATDTFGAEGAQRLTVAIRNGAFELENLGEKLASSRGAIKQNAAETRTLGENMRLLGNNLSARFVPAATEASGGLNDIVGELVKAVKGAEDADPRFVAVAEALDELAKATTDVIEGTKTIVKELAPLVDTYIDLKKKIDELKESSVVFQALAEAVDMVSNPMLGLLNLVRRLRGEQEGITARPGQTIVETAVGKPRQIDLTGDAVERVAETVDDLGTKSPVVEDLKEEFVGLKEALDQISAAKASQEFVDTWVKARGIAAPTIDEIADSAERLHEQISATFPTLEKTAELMDELATGQLAEAGGLSGLVFPPESQEVPRLIEQLNREALEGLDEASRDFFDSQEERWTSWAKQVSTIVTDFGRNIANTFVDLFFGGSDERAKLEESRANVLENLSERESDYQSFVQSVNEQLGQLEADYIQTVADNTSEIQSQLAERDTDFQEFMDDAADREREIRQTSADNLAESLANLKDNLAERSEKYGEYVQDVLRKLNRLQEDFDENLDDERKKLDGQIEDRKKRDDRRRQDEKKNHQRRIRDLEQQLKDELAKGDKTDQRRVRDIRDRIEDERQDHATKLQRMDDDQAEFISDLNARYDEFVDDQRRRLDRQNEDQQIALKRRTEDHSEYVEDVKAKEEEIRANAKTKLDGQLEDLQDNIDKRTEQYNEDKSAALKKLDEINLAAKTKYENQTKDLNSELSKQSGEFEQFKMDANAELEQIGKDEAGLSFTRKLGRAFKDMLFGPDGFVASLMRFSTESILGTFLDPIASAINNLMTGALKGLINMLVGKGVGSLADALGGLSGLGGIFGGGGGGGGATPPTVPGTGGGGGIPGIGVAAGLANPLTALFSGISAVTDVLGFFGAGTTAKDTARTEVNTRATVAALVTGVQPVLNEYLPKLKDIFDIWQPMTGAEGIFGQMHDRLIEIAASTSVLPAWRNEWAAQVGPRINISITGNQFVGTAELQDAVEDAVTSAISEAGVQLQ